MTSVPTPEALKPCPFCGCQQIDLNPTFAQCVRCKARGASCVDKEAATKFWNRGIDRSPSLSAESDK